ncbi:cysteine hydrolase [Myxococcota bacterium]|nr:cysteine hydrolase [Myxococcota bacterium]
MPIDLTPFLEPSHCAVIVFECQENVLGPSTSIPGLAAAVRDGGVLANISNLLDAAREAGAHVFYCTADSRPGGLGRARTPLLDRIQQDPSDTGTPVDTSVVKEIDPQPGDVLVSRSHGLSAFYDGGLDPCLRDLQIRTVIPVGVSLNIGLLGTTLEAVNRGYRAIVPADCAAGDPPEYGEQVLRYSMRNLAYLTTSGDIAQIWRSSAT